MPEEAQTAPGESGKETGIELSGNQDPPLAAGDGKVKKKKRRTTLSLFLELLLKIILIAVSVWILVNYIVGVNIHYGNNMYPSIRDGDLIIAYRLQRPYLNAAVMYMHEGKPCMGRVVGMPGNEIEISEEGVLMVNGVIPAEEVFYPTFPAEHSSITYPFVLADSQVFILNDFRTDCTDSRSFGPVEMKDLIGPVLLTMRRRGF